jgi:hypothetical protein
MPRPTEPPRPEITNEDASLARMAKEKAGGAAALAQLFGVTPAAASEWGRARPIPRHVRPRLQTYVGSSHTLKGQKNAGLGPLNWKKPRWRKLRQGTKIHEQVQTLLSRTKAEGPSWRAFESLLDLLQEWTEQDWKRICEECIDWVVVKRNQQ